MVNMVCMYVYIYRERYIYICILIYIYTNIYYVSNTMIYGFGCEGKSSRHWQKQHISWHHMASKIDKSGGISFAQQKDIR